MQRYHAQLQQSWVTILLRKIRLWKMIKQNRRDINRNRLVQNQTPRKHHRKLRTHSPKMTLLEVDVWSSRFWQIAIIGLAGRYPQAPDLATFWQNLTEGRDCISEIPQKLGSQIYFDANNKDGFTSLANGAVLSMASTSSIRCFLVSHHEKPNLSIPGNSCF